MRIVRNTFAIFWSPQGASIQLHANVPAPSAAEAVTAFRNHFPADVLRSVRGADGRFQRFTQ
jgi:beta-lactamase class A